jgi:hypothetical protein
MHRSGIQPAWLGAPGAAIDCRGFLALTPSCCRASMYQKSASTLNSATPPATHSVTLLASSSPARIWLENGEANSRSGGKNRCPGAKILCRVGTDDRAIQRGHMSRTERRDATLAGFGGSPREGQADRTDIDPAAIELQTGEQLPAPTPISLDKVEDFDGRDAAANRRADRAARRWARSKGACRRPRSRPMRSWRRCAVC